MGPRRGSVTVGPDPQVSPVPRREISTILLIAMPPLRLFSRSHWLGAANRLSRKKTAALRRRFSVERPNRYRRFRGPEEGGGLRVPAGARLSGEGVLPAMDIDPPDRAITMLRSRVLAAVWALEGAKSRPPVGPTG
jgi:hypothetical protein